jgi:uncharacterized protein (DUF1697 family)
MRHVALLRGINVGGKRLAMADLRRIAESLGWRDVATVLATGNLIFTPARGTPDAAKLSARLERALLDDLSLQVRVVVLSAAQVETVTREQPFGARADNPSRLLVSAYLDGKARPALAPLTKVDWSPGALALGTHAAYLWCPDGILDTPLTEAVARAARDGLTSRNWATWGKVGGRV